MNTKHTPGPWRLRELIDSTLAVYGSGEYDIVFPKRNAPRDADALLIAAAPEMLEALEATLPELHWANTHGLRCDELIAMVKGAIAKAKGDRE